MHLLRHIVLEHIPLTKIVYTGTLGTVPFVGCHLFLNLYQKKTAMAEEKENMYTRKVKAVTAPDLGKISEVYDRAFGLTYPLPGGTRVVPVTERIAWARQTRKISQRHHDACLKFWTSVQ